MYLREHDQPAVGQGSSISGEKRHHSIINSTVIRASKNAAAGLQAGITSPSRPWKKIGPEDEEILEVPGAREAYDDLDKMIDAVLARSNFYRATQTSYGDFVLAGPAAIQIEAHADDTIRCEVHPCGSYVAATNSYGQVDVFYRDYRVTGHELVSKFGDSLPGEIKDQIKNNRYGKHDLHNAIEPNPFYQEGSIGISAFPYISVWWVKGHEKNFIKVHGYYEFPVMVFRFATAEAGDVYGEGPGIDALGEAKAIQHQEDMKLRGIDKLIDPPLQAPTQLRQKGVSLIPGHVTYYDGQQKVESIYNISMPLQELRADIQEAERRVSELFFEDLFLMITQNVGRQITAREVEERHEEKLIMLGPVLESIHDEFLDPALERIMGIMRREGTWPDFPEEVIGAGMKIEYTSILAQAQRAIRTISMEQGLNAASAYAQQTGDVSVLDRIDADGWIDEYFQSIGMPGKAVRSKREAEVIREQRAAAEQQAAQMEQMAQGAAIAKDAGAAAQQIEPNVLDQILRGAA